MALAEGFFWGNDPNVNAKLRERIAMQLMGQRRAAPRNLGEGLSAIGDAIGDLGMARRLESQDLASQQAAREIAERVMGGDAPVAAAPSPAAALPVVTPAAPPAARSAAAPAIYENDQPSPLDPPSGPDRDAAIRTIVAEAGNQSPEGQAAVASVIRNRAVNGGFGGINAGGVVQSPNQFEPWNTPAGRGRMASISPQGPQYAAAGAALDSAYAGNDPTNGATNFFSPTAQASLGRPAPAWGRGPGQDIGDHRFFGGAPQPPIQQAPRLQQQIAQAPAPTRTDADPGYVPPVPATPQQPQKIPMSPVESRARLELLRNPNNEYVKQQMMPIIERETQAREFEQARQLEVWKQGIEGQRQMTIEREKALMTEAQRRLDAQKTQSEIDNNRQPKPVEINGKQYVWDANSNSFKLPKIDGASLDPNTPPEVKLNEVQSKAVKFHGWTALAEEQLRGKEKILAEGLQQELTGKVPFFGNKLQAAEYRAARSAAERFVQGFLRNISGAVIGPEELAKHMQTFLPRYGDGPRDIMNKRIARQQIIDGLYAEAGPGRAIADWEVKKRQTEQAESDKKINAEMEGKEKIVGKAYTNKKTGATRIWNGQRWEEY